MLSDLFNGISSPIVQVYTIQQNKRVPVNLETGIECVMESTSAGWFNAYMMEKKGCWLLGQK